MNPEQIRNLDPKMTAEAQSAVYLREIAAQLSEGNQHLAELVAEVTDLNAHWQHVQQVGLNVNTWAADADDELEVELGPDLPPPHNGEPEDEPV